MRRWECWATASDLRTHPGTPGTTVQESWERRVDASEDLDLKDRGTKRLWSEKGKFGVSDTVSHLS